MIHQPFPGGWYADALPTGETAVLHLPSLSILTHLGPLPLPPNNYPLFLTISNVSGFQVAGQGQSDALRQTCYWKDGVWSALPPACGTWAVIFDAAGLLHISDCSVGSQGWRYVAPDGSLVTGDSTLVIEVAPGVLIHEYTRLPDGTIIGQGHDGGVVVWDGTLRLLQPGQCFAIRSRMLGQTVSVAFYEVIGSETTAHVYQLTTAELHALPPVVAPPKPDPVPEPPKPEPPKPKPPVIPAAKPLKGVPVTVFLKSSAGKYIGVDPSKPLTVYADREHGGAWEEVSLVPNGDGTFVATFTAAKVVLSIQPDGSLQPRPEGTSGAYERLYATSQPDGCSLAYRVVEGCAVGVLTVVEG